MMKMERKNGKIYIHVKDPDYEPPYDEWTAIVDEAQFQWCVEQKRKAGFADPEGSAMLNYAYGNDCFIPKTETPRDRAQKLFDMILEEVQYRDDKVQILEALKDIIDDYLFKYAGGEDE